MPERSLFDHVSFEIELKREPGNRAFFGKNVLQGLVTGIEDFVNERQPRWKRRTHRVGAPALLGCSPWVNDKTLIAAIERLPCACVVISKTPRTSEGRRTIARLHEVNERTGGIELRALSRA
jgi:hypothetical protein